MSRYINSADALNTLKQLAYETALNQFDFDTAEVFEDIAKNRLETWVGLIPTADVVEVVRCADCKHLQYNMRPDGILPKGVDEFECRHWCGSCDPTDFCSYGERKETEDDRNS